MTTDTAIKQKKLLNRVIYAEIALLVVVALVFIVFRFSDFFSKNLFKKYFNPPNIAFYTDKETNALKGNYLQTLSKPIIKRQALLSWAELAAVSVNTLSSSTYKEQLEKTFKTYFTDKGAVSLTRALRIKGVITDILAGKLSTTSVVQGPAVLVAEGKILGNYSWKVQVPILVTYESTSDIVVEKQIVTLLIIAASTDKHPQGIAINQYSSRKRG